MALLKKHFSPLVSARYIAAVVVALISFTSRWFRRRRAQIWNDTSRFHHRWKACALVCGARKRLLRKTRLDSDDSGGQWVCGHSAGHRRGRR